VTISTNRVWLKVKYSFSSAFASTGKVDTA